MCNLYVYICICLFRFCSSTMSQDITNINNSSSVGSNSNRIIISTICTSHTDFTMHINMRHIRRMEQMIIIMMLCTDTCRFVASVCLVCFECTIRILTLVKKQRQQNRNSSSISKRRRNNAWTRTWVLLLLQCYVFKYIYSINNNTKATLFNKYGDEKCISEEKDTHVKWIVTYGRMG